MEDILNKLSNDFEKLSHNETQQFSNELRRNCYSFMKLSEYRKVSALNIYNCLIKEHFDCLKGEKIYIKNILKDDDFQELRDSLKMIFEQILPTEISKSIYGNGIVSDFDLYHNFSPKQLDYDGRTKEEIDLLKKSRYSLKKWVTRLYQGVIKNFPLEYEPFIEKELKTPDVEKAIENTSNSAKNYVEKKQPSEQVEENYDEDEEKIQPSRKLEKEFAVELNENDDNMTLPLSTKDDTTLQKQLSDITKNNKDSNEYFGTSTQMITNLFGRLEITENNLKLCDPMCGKGNILDYFGNNIIGCERNHFTSFEGYDIQYPNLILTDEEIVEPCEVDRKVDFLTDEELFNKLSNPENNYVVITNPPHSLLNAVINRLLDLHIPFITLIPFYALHYNSLRRLFEERPNSFVIQNDPNWKFDIDDGSHKKIAFGSVWVVCNSNDKATFKLLDNFYYFSFVPYEMPKTQLKMKKAKKARKVVESESESDSEEDDECFN
jgi:hypothetical protein